MDYQTLINFCIGGALALVGWLARELWGAVKELRRDIHSIETHLPQIYVRRDEFSEAIRRIEDICTRIFDKLDGKMDK